MQQYHSAHNDNEFNNLKSLYFLFLLFFFYSFMGTSYAAESDPPVLNAISVDKTFIDVSSGPQTVTFTTDTYDASGIDWDLSAVRLNIIGPKVISFSTNSNNPGEFSYTFNSNDPIGIYEITFLNLVDNVGATSYIGQSTLSSLGLPAYIEVVGGNIKFDYDFDKNGTIDALTDGLLLLRYAFGLRSDNLTNAAIGSGSSLTSEEVATNVEQAASLADIDNSGTLDALTDGLIFLRYAFGLRGDSLLSGAISSDANRTSAADIEAYIESHMP